MTLQLNVIGACKIMVTIVDLEQDMDFYSDLYKDRHGFRPRHDLARWSAWPLHDQACMLALEYDIKQATLAVSSMPLIED